MCEMDPSVIPSDPVLTILLRTGSGESGKSTIVKQMKIIHQNGYTKDELMTFRTTIYRNLLESAHNLILAMRKIGVDCVSPQNRVSPRQSSG